MIWRLADFHTPEVEVGCHTMNHLKAHQGYFELNPLFNRGSVVIFKSTGVMWSCFFILFKILAAQFWILWSGATVLANTILETVVGIQA
jgi:hypothetical protein